jgi:uncharacterized protein (TIGR03067 family)
MRIKAVILLAVVFASAGVVAGGDAKSELKKFEGTWSVASAQKGGKDAPEGELSQLRLVFSGDKLTLKFGEKSKKGSIKLDPAKKPKHIDLTIEDKTAVGLYRFKKDGMLELCVTEPGGDRPTEFKAPEGSMVMILILKREKE